MVQQVIDVGTSASDGTGDPLREAFTKINDNFTELYTTVDNEGLTYGNVASNVAGITFNVTRYAESYAASPVLRGTGQVVGNVYLIQGNVLGGTTPLNDVLLTVTTLANATVGNIATVSAAGVPIAPVLRVNGLTGNVTLTVNNITGAASKSYVNTAIASNLANVTGNITNSLNANITAANAVISNHAARINTLESNSAAQASQINNLVSVKANVTYVDTSISLALSSNAILANVAAVNANVAAANAAILLRANLTGANFSGNITANYISASNVIRTNSYFVGGTESNQGLGQQWANPAALFFSNSAVSPGPNGNNYYQINLQNLDPAGSGDIVVTADDGNDGNNFISLGMAGSQFNFPFYPSQAPHDGYVYVIGGNLDVQSDNGNVELIAGNLVTGQIILTQSNILKLTANTVIQFSDGTIQSTAFGGNSNVAAINANITAANAAITALQANAASQALDINNLFANAAVQGSSINTLTTNAASQAAALNSINANVGAYQTFANSNAASQTTSINLINANVTAANVNVTSLLANATAQALELNNLQSNAQSQQGNIIALQSNSATQAVQIDLINSNLTAANTNITSLTSNAATQGLQIGLINANLTAANVNITNLQSNAASQQLAIDNLFANVNFYLSNVATSNANIAAANARIIVIDANLGSTYSNVSTLQSNAVTQGTQINFLNANIGAANTAIQTLAAVKANISGEVFSGNVQADYIVANSNVKIASTLEVGDSTPITYPGLGGVFVGNANSYYQVVIQNLNSGSNASGDFVITADDGTDENRYINIGITSSGWSGNFTVPAGDTRIAESPYDGYITVIGGNAALRSDQNVFLAANTSAATLLKDGNFALLRSNLQFSDGTVQSSGIQDVPGLFANIGTIAVGLNSYQTFANANAASQATSINLINANLGAYQTYANTITYSNANVTNYLQAVSGNIIPVSNLTYTLGNVNFQWKEIIGNVRYTPANAANYNGTITNIQQALDELAQRIKALGG